MWDEAPAPPSRTQAGHLDEGVLPARLGDDDLELPGRRIIDPLGTALGTGRGRHVAHDDDPDAEVGRERSGAEAPSGLRTGDIDRN